MSDNTLSSAQRRYLKSLAHPLKPLLQVGKDGASSAFLNNLLEQLEIHELIKVRILGNYLGGKEELHTSIEAVGVTVIQKIGHVLTLFKQREEDSQIEFPR